MKNVVILNVSCGVNIGDLAIQQSAFSFLKDFFDRGDVISIICDGETDYRIKELSGFRLKFHESPYGQAISSPGSRLSIIPKVCRFISIVSVSSINILSIKFFGKLVFTGKSYSYITDIRDADVVVSMGGGYIRTKHPFFDYYGLILTMLPLYLARFLWKRTLFLPASFGNFANNSHMQIAYRAILGSTYMCRESESLKMIRDLDKKNKKVKSVYAPDLAFFLNSDSKVSLIHKKKSNYIVLTARDWFDSTRQEVYEKTLSECVKFLFKNYSLKTIFLPMAFNPIEDDDRDNGKRLSGYVNDSNAFSIANATDPKEAMDLLSHARFAICTRMHSAILAALVRTPFISIGYEYKTKGTMEALGVSQWCLDIDTLQSEILIKKVCSLLEKSEYDCFIDTIEKKWPEIQSYKMNIQDELRNFFSYAT